jgi:hypothetical protein
MTVKMRASMQRLPACHAFVEIPPFRIVALDQIKLPDSAPLLELLFPKYGVRHCLVEFRVNQLMDAILRGETLDGTRLVFPDSADDIVGHADVERAVAFAGENVHAGAAHGMACSIVS